MAKRSSKERVEEVWKLFDEISCTYDLLNHLLSLGSDIYWRRKMVAHLPKGANIRLLDLATGTGDQLITIVKKARQVQAALGIDLSTKMIRLGQKKIIDKPYSHQVTLMEGDATDISLENETVDCVTMSFGIRNVEKTQRCLEECYRVLTPGGKLLFLEFSIPKNRLIKNIYLPYLRYIVPCIAGWISRKKSAYHYLHKTIETFPSREEFCQCIKRAGFNSVKYRPLTFGVATLYTGEKHI